MSDIGNTTVILPSMLYRTNQYILKYCTEQQISANIHLESGGFQAGLELYRQNKGMLLITDYIEDHVGAGDLISIPVGNGLSDLELVLLV